MSNPSKSSPESPAKEQPWKKCNSCSSPASCEWDGVCYNAAALLAKEQPGDIEYWKECYGCASPTRCMKEDTCYIQKFYAAPQAQAKGFAHEQSENGFESRKPVAAAHDVAAMKDEKISPKLR